MAKTTMNAHLVTEPGAETQETIQLHIDNMPAGSAPADGSIATAMLADGAVTDTKLAANAVGEGNIKDSAVTRAKVKVDTLAATTEAPGLVKKAAAVAAVSIADAAQAAAAPTKDEYDSLVALANDCKKQLNALVNALKGAGVLS